MSMMIFIFLCFAGLFVMFFFILRSQEILCKTMREELDQTRTQLRLVEARLATLLGEEDVAPPVQAQPPLEELHSLSMDIPTSASTADHGLDLHFDPEEPRRR